MKNVIFWDVAQCRFCVNRRFGGSRHSASVYFCRFVKWYTTYYILYYILYIICSMGFSWGRPFLLISVCIYNLYGGLLRGYIFFYSSIRIVWETMVELIDPKGFWRRCITFRIIVFFLLCPSSPILETRRHKVSETRSVSVLRWGGGRHLLCWAP
jgi:hypothetical protein